MNSEGASRLTLLQRTCLKCRICRRHCFHPGLKNPWRGKWRPTPVFLPGEAPWMEEPGGLQSMGSQRVRVTQLKRLSHAHEFKTYWMRLKKKINGTLFAFMKVVHTFPSQHASFIFVLASAFPLQQRPLVRFHSYKSILCLKVCPWDCSQLCDSRKNLLQFL